MKKLSLIPVSYTHLDVYKRQVLTKEPKVHSTAIRQMREEIKKIQLIFVHIKKDE